MQDSIQNKTVSSGYLAPQYGGVAIYGRCDWLFYSGDGSESYYQGTNLLSSSEMASWKNTFERLQNACDKKGITLVIMVAPNKEQIYSEYMPTYKIATDEKRQDRFLAYMQKNSSVKYLYPYNDLITAKYFYDVFYKQDTHWNAIGGFMGSMALYRALGMSTTNLFDLNITEHTRFGGDLSNFSGFTSEYTDYIVNYKPEVKTSVQYFENSTGGENELCQYTSDSANDAKIVVIADSFRHAMSQYISKDFARATISHRSDVGRRWFSRR